MKFVTFKIHSPHYNQCAKDKVIVYNGKVLILMFNDLLPDFNVSKTCCKTLYIPVWIYIDSDIIEGYKCSLEKDSAKQ